MMDLSNIISIGGALITAVATLSVALNKIKTLEKEITATNQRLENAKEHHDADHVLLVEIKTKLDLLLSGQLGKLERRKDV